jgi:hypothetical protein
MASYLSYFTSNSASAPTQQQYNQAQPATSTWANTFSSRIATLRKALTEDDDPDNEDCSHVSNVLRAYYTQKGRQFPEWLPPDPKKPQAPPPQQQYGQYGNMYNNQYGTQTHGRVDSGGGKGGLSDLWDSNAAQSPPPQSQSLRAPRQTPQSLRSPDLTARQNSQGSSGSLDPYSGSQTTSMGARPLPSQRAGSFQNTQAAGATSKADRLRARLQGGNSGRNSPSASGYPGESESYERQDGNASSGTGNPYTSSNEPWSSSNTGGRDLGAGVNSRGFGNPAYRPRPGAPR